jgi:hypothetical protein
MTSEIQLSQPAELVRQSTDIAGLCKQIVLKSAMEIQGRKYVKVEGWQSIATAHGCLASSRDVERIEGGYKAIGEVRRMSDGSLLASAEGFVGEDEPTWFGGPMPDGHGGTKTLPKRPDYAIRAMCQTRAISRACRSAFAHVVVMMDCGLSTTPAEEVPQGGFHDEPEQGRITEDVIPGKYWDIKRRQGIDAANKWLGTAYDGARVGAKKTPDGWRVVVFGEDGGESSQDGQDGAGSGSAGSTQGTGSGSGSGSAGAGPVGSWRNVKVHFGKKNGPILGKTLGELPIDKLDWLRGQMEEKAKLGTRNMKKDERQLLAALVLELAERKSAGAGDGSFGEATAVKPKFNGPNHEALAQSLEFAKVSIDDFMRCGIALGWFTGNAIFPNFPEEKAKEYVEDIGTVQEEVREWLKAQADGKALEDDHIPGLEPQS